MNCKNDAGRFPELRGARVFYCASAEGGNKYAQSECFPSVR